MGIRVIGLDRAPDTELWEHAACEGYAIAPHAT